MRITWGGFDAQSGLELTHGATAHAVAAGTFGEEHMTAVHEPLALWPDSLLQPTTSQKAASVPEGAVHPGCTCRWRGGGSNSRWRRDRPHRRAQTRSAIANPRSSSARLVCPRQANRSAVIEIPEPDLNGLGIPKYAVQQSERLTAMRADLSAGPSL